MKVIFLSKVKLNYPSKTYTRKVEDECDARIVRNIVDGTSTGVANAVWASEQLKSCLLKKVEKNIQDECSSLCSKKSRSILANTSPTHIISLKDVTIISELEERAPTLYRCLPTAVSSKRKAGVQKKNTTAALSMASSILLRCRNPALSANAYRLSVLLWHGGAQKQVPFYNFINKSNKTTTTITIIIIIITIISLSLNIQT